MRGNERRQSRRRWIGGEGRRWVRLAGRGQCLSRRACLRHGSLVRFRRARMVVRRSHRRGGSRFGEGCGFHCRPASRHSGARRPSGAPGPERMREEQQQGDDRTHSTASAPATPACAAGWCPPESRKRWSLSLHGYSNIYAYSVNCNSAPISSRVARWCAGDGTDEWAT